MVNEDEKTSNNAKTNSYRHHLNFQYNSLLPSSLKSLKNKGELQNSLHFGDLLYLLRRK